MNFLLEKGGLKKTTTEKVYVLFYKKIYIYCFRLPFATAIKKCIRFSLTIPNISDIMKWVDYIFTIVLL